MSVIFGKNLFCSFQIEGFAGRELKIKWENNPKTNEKIRK
jgi:hypothetical protein